MKKHKRKPLTKLTKILLATAAVLIVGQLVLNGYLFYRVNQTHDTIILELISQSLDTLHKPAPVDPKTGNIYFPEAHLYVTAQPNDPQLLYSYYSDGGDMDFSVTAGNVLSTGKSRMWAKFANETRHGDGPAMKAAFDEVPHLQACARGLQLFYSPQQLDGHTEQFHTPLANGKTLYGYTEAACRQDLSPIVNAFKTAKSY